MGFHENDVLVTSLFLMALDRTQSVHAGLKIISLEPDVRKPTASPHFKTGTRKPRGRYSHRPQRLKLCANID
jgi:hypothetical protein